MKNLKWKLLTIVGVIVFAAAMIYPPVRYAGHRRGGSAWASTSRAACSWCCASRPTRPCSYTSEDAAERLRLALREKNIAGPTITVTAPRRRGSPSPACRSRWTRRSAPWPTPSPGWSPSTPAPAAAGGYTFELKPNVAQTLRTQAVEQALQTVERRVNALGVSEPIVAPYGTAGDQILVQLPGVNDPDQVKRLIGTTALLELKIVEGGPAGFAGGAAPGDRRRRAARDGGRHRAPTGPTPARSPITLCARWRRSPAATSATPAPRSTRTTCRRSPSR